MDLLGQVLARLPLQEFLELHHQTPSFFESYLINVRLHVVNRLSIEYLNELASKVPNVVDRYLMLCTAQGELYKGSVHMLPKATICARAAFLREKFLYRYYMEEPIPFDLNIDLALATEDLDIIIPTLETSVFPYSITDPNAVNWLVGSRNSYSEGWQSDPTSRIIAVYRK
jgi:hypothetical protein